MIPAARILVPVNGSPTDDEAIALACELARPAKALVFTLYVIQVRRTLPLDVDLPEESDRGEEILARAQRVGKTYGVRVEGDILQARDVGTAIVDEATDRQIDLLVMGVAYERKFGEFNLGQTIPYVLKNATCRVWIVRAAIDAPAPAVTTPDARPPRH